MNLPPLDEEDRRELLWRSYLAVQREQRELGRLPPERPTVLTRIGGLLAVAGAVQLGAFVAIIGVFLVFIVTRLVLHLDLTRYFG